ncbi:MAG: divergent polysaccharide deacetylase family protein [Mariprofundaceae bacterium]
MTLSRSQRKTKKTKKKRGGHWLAPFLLAVLALLGISIGFSFVDGESEPTKAMPKSATKALEEIPLFEDYRYAPEIKESIPPDVSLDASIHVTPQPTNMPGSVHGIAIIIDDMGRDRDATRRILALPYPVALSILPDEPHAVFTAKATKGAGKDVMLHLPMEPENGHYSHRMNSSFLRVSMPPWQQKKLLLNALNTIPYVIGINNHMGSKLTAHRPSMRNVMQVLKQKDLFFIDSRTTKETVAAIEAERIGIRWNRRHIFLDHIVDANAIRRSWKQAVKRHRQGESVIVIGHPHPETLYFLEHEIDQEIEKSIVPITFLLHIPS